MAVSGQPDSVGTNYCYPSQVTLEPLHASDPNQVAEVLQVCCVPLVDDSPASNFQWQKVTEEEEPDNLHSSVTQANRKAER